MKPPFDIAADLDTPVSAFLKLKPLGARFLLESVERGEQVARFSFLGLGSVLDLHLDPQVLNLNGNNAFRTFRPRRGAGRVAGGITRCAGIIPPGG